MGIISDAAVSRGDLGREQAEVRRDIEAARSARRAEHTSIQSGAVRVLTDDGIVLAHLGTSVDFGGASQGWRLNYATGRIAFGLGGDPGSQVWQLWDGDGHYVITPDGVSGVGLARPYLNYQIAPTADAESASPQPLWPSTTSSTAVALMEGWNSIWHPKIAYKIATATSDGGGVEWSLKVGAEVAASGTGSDDDLVDIPGWGTDINPGDRQDITVEANLTGTATRGWIQVTGLLGAESFD